ncbi:MAG: protein-disulfide reductase DsbD family protein [Candidatus Andeanibacterium colombiense]|uniref:Protein-disulfide reductase DsbD family protein n=1 Tax=Candidatus Andeanibacterium colombiense TaxID=3121345 RepID=A0AAJ6BP68_9SPHN|nr:MAG: protein-disulfide reductase DsbD family protein [Sphingomonadaceae bacterium]
MPLSRKLLALFSLLLAAFAVAPAYANHMAAELVAKGPVSPGSSTELAIVMTPEPGWHGYWSNPGDAGYGMGLDWSLPPGWKAGEPEYPVPQTLLSYGLMNHVYEGPYALLVPLAVPKDAVPGSTVSVTLKAQWLVCNPQTCVPERGTLATVVKIGSGPAEPRFDKWRAAIPPLLDSKASFALAGGKLRIGIPLPASLDLAAPHVFLSTTELIDYAAPQVFRREGDLLVAELKLKGAAPAPGEVSGILKLDDAGDGVRFVGVAGSVPAGGAVLADAAGQAPPPLWSLLGLALLGGLLLNIMPCVFPILSLKALSLARAGESEAHARADGLAYTAGVMLACLALGGVMLALRAAGNEIGWAFQLQEPGVVVFLLVLAAAITANFAGLFELPGLSFSGSGTPLGAFATGLLAAFVATPCTGPFMAAAMGAALLLPPAEALLLFAALGLGIALPFLALGFVPPLRRLLPKPGRWMDIFRKVMAVPMGLTALALVWLLWKIGGQWFALMSVQLAVVVIITLSERRYRWLGWSFAAVGVLALTQLPEQSAVSAEEGVIAAKPFSEAALAEARKSGKPVFVWFTADWCLTCKVNEGVAIEREDTKAAFEKAGVVALKGDWTRRDPAITRFLNARGAAGIPLYLWYSPGGEVEQLPQVLTPATLTDLAKAG